MTFNIDEIGSVLQDILRTGGKDGSFMVKFDSQDETNDFVLDIVRELTRRLTDTSCNCINVDIGSYSNQTPLINPFTRKPVGIDNCLLKEIKMLWKVGIETIECCCGHNKASAYIIVNDRHMGKMDDLGYEFHINNQGTPIYIPKTIKSKNHENRTDKTD